MLDIEVVDIGEQAHVVGTNLDINVSASDIYVKDAAIRISSLYVR